MNGWGSTLYLVVLALLVPFGAHRLRLLWLRLRRPPRSEAETWTGALPVVTVQLPIYNEANVVARLIDTVCALDYPVDRLEIQVLDDSDDETVERAADRVASWRARGFDIHHVRRGTRDDFKSGALALGAERARGEFVLVLDADFVPPPELIRSLLPPFSDGSVGAVQAAWDHLNRDANWLTRAQALFLDAHFAIEHEARYRADLFFNFNGSAGMWRLRCIEESGGWQGDTLTEDIDLSYRAQIAGWRFVYRDAVRVPAELPTGLRSVEIQQSRWTQGGIQSARKLLPSVFRAPLPMAVKLEAAAHLLGHAVHPLTLLLGITLAAFGWLGAPGSNLPGWIHAMALGLATIPFVLFYGLAGRLRDRSSGLVRDVGAAMLLGLGLGVPLTAAVVRALRRTPTPFERTPKRGFEQTVPYRADLARLPALARAVLALALAGATAKIASLGLVTALPFTALFATGYLVTTRESMRRPAPPAVPGQ